MWKKSVVLLDFNHASKWNTSKWLSQTWRKCQMQLGSGGTLCTARWHLFTNNSLGCWAISLTLTRIWQVGQSWCFGFFWKRVGLLSWRLNLGWCLFSSPSSHGSRAQVITNVLVLGWGQFSLMFSSPEIVFAPFIGRRRFWGEQPHG